jgi:hypothetical protein
MKSLGALLILTAVVAWAQPQRDTVTAPGTNRPSPGTLQPSLPMRRLLKTFSGEWKVSEAVEVSATQQGRTRQGLCTIQAGPGFSMLEDCRTNGSAGELQFLAVLWWDSKADAYPFFTCANIEGCAMRGTARWEGNRLVNSWEEQDKGKRVTYKDSFVDLSPTSFRLVSQGVSDGTTVWRVVTNYVRRPAANGDFLGIKR